MDANEIMTNDEVILVTEEIATASSSKGFKVAAGIGLAVLAGGIAYKYIAKPLVAKIKDKKNQQAAGIDVTEDTEDCDVEADDCDN